MQWIQPLPIEDLRVLLQLEGVGVPRARLASAILIGHRFERFPSSLHHFRNRGPEPVTRLAAPKHCLWSCQLLIEKPGLANLNVNFITLPFHLFGNWASHQNALHVFIVGREELHAELRRDIQRYAKVLREHDSKQEPIFSLVGSVVVGGGHAFALMPRFLSQMKIYTHQLPTTSQKYRQ